MIFSGKTMELKPFYPVSDKAKAHSYLSEQDYKQMYQQSIQDPEGF